MNINGSWEYDDKIVKSLNLNSEFLFYLQVYKKNSAKAMTALMIDYLTKRYPEEKEELRLIMRKAK
jgi:hypothetical protein